MGVLNTTKKSTGGGGAGGGGDRYLGTLGLAADAPSSNKYPNFLTFPAAVKGEWVQATANNTISGKNIKRGQQWVCSVPSTVADTPASWELRANHILTSFTNAIQLIRRDVSFSPASINLQRNIIYRINFTQSDDILKGSRIIPKDSRYVEISDLVLYSDKLYYDVSIGAEFTPENSGSRRVVAISSEFFPTDNMGAKDEQGRLILGDRLDPVGGGDTRIITYDEKDAIKEGRFTNLLSIRTLYKPEYFDVFQTVISVLISHTADVPIGLQSAFLEISAYEVA